jgi:hypothetical protein
MSDWSSSEEDCEIIEEEPSAASIAHRTVNQSSFIDRPPEYATPAPPVVTHNEESSSPAPSLNFKINIPVLDRNTISAETWDLDKLLGERKRSPEARESTGPKKNFI